jgi:aryl-alcohol dehydrogenase-like predicted oxidoreductase
MNTRTFGRLGWPVSEVGYGLWGMGGWSGSNDDESLAALDRSIGLGCTFFDTALAYGNGRSEQLLGRALEGHRDKTLRVATKVPPKNGRWPASPEYPLTDVFPADHIRRSTETSLEHLGLDAIDLQQFHVWTDAWADDDRWKRAVDDLKSDSA